MKETNSLNAGPFKKLEESIELHKTEGIQIHVRMAIVEKEVADFLRDIEKVKGNRSTLINGLIIALISASISIGGTVLTTIFFKPK